MSQEFLSFSGLICSDRNKTVGMAAHYFWPQCPNCLTTLITHILCSLVTVGEATISWPGVAVAVVVTLCVRCKGELQLCS